MSAPLQLQLKYHDFFKKYCPHIKERIDVTKNAWMKDLQGIIEEDDLQDIDFEMDNAEKVVKIVDYLIKKNSVVKYKKFIQIWKTYDEATATRYEINLKKVIDNAGLTAEDKKIQIDLPLGIVYKLFLFHTCIRIKGSSPPILVILLH